MPIARSVKWKMVGDGEAAIKMFHVKHFVTEKKFRFTENIGQVLQAKGINFSGKGGRKKKILEKVWWDSGKAPVSEAVWTK